MLFSLTSSGHKKSLDSRRKVLNSLKITSEWVSEWKKREHSSASVSVQFWCFDSKDLWMKVSWNFCLVIIKKKLIIICDIKFYGYTYINRVRDCEKQWWFFLNLIHNESCAHFYVTYNEEKTFHRYYHYLSVQGELSLNSF